MASKVNSAMATIQTAIEALTPVSDGSAAVYAFIDDFVEERGNGQHRQLIWDMPTTWRAGDVVETRERTLQSFSLFLFRTPTGIGNRTQLAWINAVHSEVAHIHRTIEQITVWGDADVLEVLFVDAEAEDVSPDRPNQSGGIHRPLVARITFNLDIFTQEND